jgi:hypothetical protein
MDDIYILFFLRPSNFSVLYYCSSPMLIVLSLKIHLHLESYIHLNNTMISRMINGVVMPRYSYCLNSAINLAQRPPCHPRTRSHSLLSPLPWAFPKRAFLPPNTFWIHNRRAASTISANEMECPATNFCPSFLFNH